MHTKQKGTHTPGFWEAKKNILNHWFVIAPRASGFDIGITDLTPVPTEGSAESNARLIAAAPELLEACKIVLDLCYEEESHLMMEEPPYLKLIRKAIAKAEGRE